MTGAIAARSAIFLSIASLLCCFMFVPLLISKVSNIQSFLETDSDEFRLLSNEIWANIQEAKGGAIHRPRPARQVAICRKESFICLPNHKIGEKF